MAHLTRLGIGPVVLGPLWLGALGGALLGCSGSDGGSAASRPTTHPSDTSAAGITAFLDAETYKGEGWTSETAAPRASDASHSGEVRVWYNELAAGVPLESDEYPVNSMAVKELYEENELVGIAVILKNGEGTNANSWLYYCYGPSGRCSNSEPAYTKDAPLLSTGFDDSCGYCHSAILTRP